MPLLTVTALAISIHAPTRGATTVLLDKINFKTISIHAPTRGATLAELLDCVSKGNFNPRSHEGSDVTLLKEGVIL